MANEARGTGCDPLVFRSRLEIVREGIARAAEKSLRTVRDIELMAVSKFRSLDEIRVAYEAGIRSFGENRVQEAAMKHPAFVERCPGARMDLIGHLQSNKINKACAIFDRIQSVDSMNLLLELEKFAAQTGSTLLILLELHTAEESKSGFMDMESIFQACDYLTRTGNSGSLMLRGLMTMAPFTSDEILIRASFRKCREAFRELDGRYELPGFDTLSMGMSDDYMYAIEEGATVVRIGTALFGERTR